MSVTQTIVHLAFGLVLLQIAGSEDTTMGTDFYSEELHLTHTEFSSEELDLMTELGLNTCFDGAAMELGKVVFQYFDLNKDKIMNEEDATIELNVLERMYPPELFEKEFIKNRVYKFYSYLTFNDLERGISVVEFINQTVPLGGETMELIFTATSVLKEMLDSHRDGHLDNPELNALHVALNRDKLRCFAKPVV